MDQGFGGLIVSGAQACEGLMPLPERRYQGGVRQGGWRALEETPCPSMSSPL